ncbi:hypothetical protein L596_029342 [Steinernema carpocapsae]|uniref:28S ribosomal protein S30, mitochondrial n=1 Tax=Steinernema carpocapsae TaxID=34508 RepID=A0A4U5LUD1_STECR|nr:hypothetical protein L596_029342 [Steinernema carpocapsae]
MRRSSAIVTKRVIGARFSSTKSSAAVVSGGEQTAPVKPPYYRKTLPAHKPMNMLQEEYPNLGDKNGHGPRLYDYHNMAEQVRALPTATERINFVNPFEREWNDVENTWRRQWHPQLMAPRKAWNVPSVPKYFDSLDFYKYITKSRVVADSEEFDKIYSGLVLPTNKFEERLLESLESMESANSVDLSESERMNRFLRTVLDDAMVSLAHNVERFQDLRLAHTTRCESFWVRSGFLSMYDHKDVGSDEIERRIRFANKFIGDDRRKLGELSFVLRDQVAAQLRSKKAPKQLFDIASEDASKPVFGEDVDVADDVIYSPKVFNMWPDSDILWQCPGYESDSNESHKYGHLAIKEISELNNLLDYWKVEGEEFEQVKRDAMTSTAVTSLFSWLNAQAHCLGYTQYTDLDRPLVSHPLRRKRLLFRRCAAQHNRHQHRRRRFINNKSNVCYVDGPHPLFVEEALEGEAKDDKDKELGLKVNQHVLTRILQMLRRE